nr:histidine kinase 4 [Ipomoea batatas]
MDATHKEKRRRLFGEHVDQEGRMLQDQFSDSVNMSSPLASLKLSLNTLPEQPSRGVVEARVSYAEEKVLNSHGGASRINGMDYRRWIKSLHRQGRVCPGHTHKKLFPYLESLDMMKGKYLEARATGEGCSYNPFRLLGLINLVSFLTSQVYNSMLAKLRRHSR